MTNTGVKQNTRFISWAEGFVAEHLLLFRAVCNADSQGYDALFSPLQQALKYYSHRQNTHIHKINLEMVVGFEFSFVTPSVRKEVIYRSGITRRAYKNDWQVVMEVGEQTPL